MKQDVNVAISLQKFVGAISNSNANDASALFPFPIPASRTMKSAYRHAEVKKPVP
jgi:hypothetical protein